MSPEQVAGAPLGPATDVWGLGLTVYAAAVGDLALLSDDAVPSRLPSIRRRRRLPAPLAALLDACLEPDPERRPTVRALAAGVSECGLAA
jgi:serine/threonine protein kinase